MHLSRRNSPQPTTAMHISNPTNCKGTMISREGRSCYPTVPPSVSQVKQLEMKQIDPAYVNASFIEESTADNILQSSENVYQNELIPDMSNKMSTHGTPIDHVVEDYTVLNVDDHRQTREFSGASISTASPVVRTGVSDNTMDYIIISTDIADDDGHRFGTAEDNGKCREPELVCYVNVKYPRSQLQDEVPLPLNRQLQDEVPLPLTRQLQDEVQLPLNVVSNNSSDEED